MVTAIVTVMAMEEVVDIIIMVMAGTEAIIGMAAAAAVVVVGMEVDIERAVGMEPVITSLPLTWLHRPPLDRISIKVEVVVRVVVVVEVLDAEEGL
jgi:hypothetical protein